MTFLFDIGRVLLDFDFEGSLEKLLPEGCADAPQRLAALLERKDELESGAIPSDDYIGWALETLGTDAGPDRFRALWRHIFTRNEPMWRVVDALSSAGHRLLLFSNTNAIHCPWLFDAYPEFACFDGAILSYQAGSMKPADPIYEYAIRHYGLDPARTLYIDDLPDNIATGRRFGFSSWQYDLNDHAAFLSWLSRHCPPPQGVSWDV